MDTSKEIFTIDKDILSLKINSDYINRVSISEHPTIVSESEFEIKNITNKYIAFRIKTTKKQYYTVNPSYCVIPPNSNQKINLVYYLIPGEKVNSTGHKFKIEGFIISDSEKDENVKDIFSKYANNRIKVEGNIQKRFVQFVEDKEYVINKENEIEPKISRISEYSVAPNQEQKLENQPFTSKRFMEDEPQPQEFKIKEKLKILKDEYNKLKSQIDNLNINQENIKRRIQYEKNNLDNSANYSTKFKYEIPKHEEKQIHRIVFIWAFVLSTLIGFYLTK